MVIGQFPVPKLKEDKKDYNEDDLWEELDATQFNKGSLQKFENLQAAERHQHNRL